MTSSSSPPSSITGGCLCRSVRYKITFPPDHDFSTACSTCQCSQCRQQTGSLVFRVHSLPASAVDFTSSSTLTNFHATRECSRGFCSQCGGLLYWRRDGSGRLSMLVGTFDPEVLRRWGRVLCEARKHLFCGDEIEGVTDHLKGVRYREDDDGEQMLKSRL